MGRGGGTGVGRFLSLFPLALVLLAVLCQSPHVVAADSEEAEEQFHDALDGAAEDAPALATGAAEDLGKSLTVSSNDDCRWSWRRSRCEPVGACKYKYQFLDATIGESCRAVDLPTRKHPVSGGLKMSPLAAVGGALGLFAADLLAISCTPLLKQFPRLFNAVQGFVLLFSGDALFQVLEQGWQKEVGIKLRRMVRSGLIGMLNNGILHFEYYKWIDKRFPYHKFNNNPKVWGPPSGNKYQLGVAMTKYWIEWPTVGVYKISSMIALTNLMAGGTWDQLKVKFRKTFILTQLRSLQVWPLYDTWLYLRVPADKRPLYNSFMSILWGGYLSHVSQIEGGDAEEGHAVEEKEEGEL